MASKDIYNNLTNLDNPDTISRGETSNITNVIPYTEAAIRELKRKEGWPEDMIDKYIRDDWASDLMMYNVKNSSSISSKELDKATVNLNGAYEGLSAAMEYYPILSHINDTRHINEINRFRLVQDNDGVIGKKAFIFMTRPNLNLFKTETDGMTSCTLQVDNAGRLIINPNLARLPTYNYVWNLGKNEFHRDDSWTNPSLGLSIFQSLNMECDQATAAGRHKSPWLSIITNTATSYSVQQRELDSASAGATFHGNQVRYGEPTFGHKTAGDVTISFTDKRDLSLYYTLKIWLDYIHQVVLGTAAPYRKYICKAMLDYAVSLYYIVTDETMENILYWEKLTGVFPKNVPDDIFSANESAFKSIETTNLEYSITFTYSMRSVQHEHHLNEINALYAIVQNDTTYLTMDQKITDEGLHAVDTKNVNNLYKLNKGNYNILSNKFADNAFNYYNGNDSANTFADGLRFTDYLKNIRTYYGFDESKESPAWRYYSIIKNTDNAKAKFLANWLPDIQTHGVPFVNGPYITMGSSYGVTDDDNADIISETNEQAKYNKGQYKLRWI